MGVHGVGKKRERKAPHFLTSTRELASDRAECVEVRGGTREGGPGFRLLWCGIKTDAMAARGGGSSERPQLALVALLVGVFALCVANLPSWDDMESYATPQILGAPALGDQASAPFHARVLGFTRLFFAATVFGASSWLMAGPGWVEDTSYHEKSSLRPAPVRIKGLRVMVFFTNWSWAMLGLYFLGSGLVALYPEAMATVSPRLLGLVLAAWEIAAPNALLVTVVVSFVIWPEVLLKAGTEGSARLKVPVVLLQHCGNTAMVAAELLLGRTPLLLSHASLAPLFGTMYVVFAWWWAPRAAPEYGPQYLYFFLDTTLGAVFCSVAFLGLLSVLLVFYCLAWGVDVVLEMAKTHGVPVALQTIVLAAAVRAICRFRD